MTDIKGDIVLEKTINLKKDFPPHNYKEWKKLAEKSLKEGSFENSLVHKTIEGIEIKPLYSADEVNGIVIADSDPGVKPFIRGGNAKSSFRGNDWHICQRGYETSPKGLNGELKKEIEGGGDSLRIDVSPEISGVYLTDLKDIDDIFDKIDIKKHPIIFNPGDKFTELFITLKGLCKKRYEKLKDLQIFLNADPLGLLAKNGKLDGNIENYYKKIALMLMSHTQNREFGVRVLGVSVLPYHNAGCSASEEIAFSLASIVEYTEALSIYGIDFDNIISSTLFGFGLGSDFFAEISKVRAFRVLLSKISDKYNSVKNSGDFRIFGEVSGFSYSKKDPYINVLRATTSALSGIVGGVDFLTISPFDSSINNPEDFSKRVARNIQLVLKEESGMKDYVDPSAGSYFIESLTMELMKKGWDLFLKIEKAGGMLKSLKSGYIMDLVKEKMAQRKKNIKDGRSIMVGVNKFEDKKAIGIKDNTHTKTMVNKYTVKEKIEKNSEIESLLKKMKKEFSRGDISFLNSGVDAVLAGSSMEQLNLHLNGSDRKEKLDSRFEFERVSEEFESGGEK